MTTFKEYHDEQKLVENLVQNGVVGEITEEQTWSEAMSADKLFEELGLDGNIQEV